MNAKTQIEELNVWLKEARELNDSYAETLELLYQGALEHKHFTKEELDAMFENRNLIRRIQPRLQELEALIKRNEVLLAQYKTLCEIKTNQNSKG